jgi:hypothetical protein
MMWKTRCHEPAPKSHVFYWCYKPSRNGRWIFWFPTIHLYTCIRVYVIQPITYPLNTKYMPIKYPLHTHYISIIHVPIKYRLYTHHIPIIYPLCIHCTSITWYTSHLWVRHMCDLGPGLVLQLRAPHCCGCLAVHQRVGDTPMVRKNGFYAM